MIAKEIRVLAETLRQKGYHLTIETAGTIAPQSIACDLASISPKLRNSLPDERLPLAWRERHEATRFRPEVLREWVDRYPYQFKFVISSPEDLTEVEQMIGELQRPLPPHKILLMPEATSLERLRERAAWLSDVCKANGYRYAHRLHIELYGNRRGT